jgi:hypothetical protein
MGRGYFNGAGINVSLQEGVLIRTYKDYFHIVRPCSPKIFVVNTILM